MSQISCTKMLLQLDFQSYPTSSVQQTLLRQKEFRENIKKAYIIPVVRSGLIIITAPDKPNSIAVHLKMPTFSLRKRIERIQIKIGITCDKASALLISK